MDANERKLKQEQSVKAMLFDEIEERGLLVNCPHGAPIQVRDGKKIFSGGSLMAVMLEVVK